MKTISTSVRAVTLALAALAGTQAMAYNVDTTVGTTVSDLRATVATASTMTQAQPKRELQAARFEQKSPAMDITVGTDISDLRSAMQNRSGKTRAQVRAEFLQSLGNAQ